MPDLTGDGKVTRADVLKGRGVFKHGGKVKKYASGGSATFTALDEDGKPYIKTKTRKAPDKSQDTEDRKVSRNSTYFQGPLGLMTITPLDEDGKPSIKTKTRKVSRDSTNFKGGNTFTALDEDGKPYIKTKTRDVEKYASGGSVSSASKRADGCAVKGKTKGRFV
jgi:type III secretory pathway component EscU